MKSITQLVNTAKAKLLHELFPEEVKPFLEHLSRSVQISKSSSSNIGKAGTLDFSASMNG